ncbi:MAG: DNA-directed RNA polymerase subunit B [Candidatus Aenigmatarchaeota archaeon]|nr:MAG: DNA-directed RNA polymerase subunit B [Candidatus Aenigmarchaeota archaeon]
MAASGTAKEHEQADVYFNGRFITQTKTPASFVDDIRKKRRNGLIPSQMNVAYYPEYKEVRITTEPGRVRRPLVIVENGKHKLTSDIIKKLDKGEINLEYLIEHGIIEYLDAEEEENSYISIDEEHLTSDHTHMEIDPMIIMGTSAVLIPYPEYNRGDRINYGAKMVGQAISIMSTNFPVRMDTKFNVMAYPQAPLVRTNMSGVLDKYPEGHNVVLAIMVHEGYNLNDAVIMNKSSIERGLFRSFYFRTYETIKKRYWGGQEDEIKIPDPGIKGHRGEAAYKNLSEDGIISPEIPVHSDSVLVGKVSPLRFLSAEEFTSDIENKREASVVVRHGEEGLVDDVIISETTNANQLFKVRIRNQRIPELGDKYAARHGQKGVVGLLVPQEDMPFTSNGVVPDVIFNPHAIPSRMTVGHLLEILAGKMGAYYGERPDGSAFNHITEDEIRDRLTKMGFRDDGKEVLYNGKTGEMYEVMIFTGMTYYMKLDHMVADKIHARSRGPVTLLTKQPTEGRAKRGGLRVGEMEQQCLVGHGAVLTLKERFDSDKATIPICKKCGLIGIHDVIKNRVYCPICKNSEIAWVDTGYAFKLTLDELKAMCVYPKVGVEEM